MVNDTDKSNRFLKELLLGFLPHELIRTCVYLLFRPRAFVSDVQQANWNQKSHPAAFLVAALAIYGFVDPWVDTYSFEPQWYESYLELSETDQKRFLETIGLSGDESNSVPGEAFLPNATSASKSIKRTVGSLDVNEIALHLAAQDPDLAKSFSKGVSRVKRFKKASSYLLAPSLAAAWAVGALIVHGLLRVPGQRFRVAFDILIYWQGFWLVLTQLIIILGKFTIPVGSSVWSVAFALVEFAIFAATFLHGCWLFGLAYSRPIWLRIIAIVLAFVVALVINVAVFIMLAIVMSLIP